MADPVRLAEMLRAGQQPGGMGTMTDQEMMMANMANAQQMGGMQPQAGYMQSPWQGMGAGMGAQPMQGMSPSGMGQMGEAERMRGMVNPNYVNPMGQMTEQEMSYLQSLGR